MKHLLEKGLITKEVKDINGVKYCEYCIVSNKVGQGIQLSCMNNIAYKQENKNNSKELLENPKQFEFGVKKPINNKPSLYDKCLSLIYEFTDDIALQNNLKEYLRYRLEVKDKPLYANMWKGMLKKLEKVHQETGVAYVEIVCSCLERGYLSFYPCNVPKHTNPEKLVNKHVESYTQDELEQLAELAQERERNGQRSTF